MSLPWRTRAFCAVVDRLSGSPLSEKSLRQIERARLLRPPHWFPLSLIFGRVPRDVTWHDEQATTPAGSLRVRVYSPAGSAAGRPLVLYFHGGGWVTGSVPGFDAVCGQIASRVSAVVVSVDYRLAPEHPFPAAVEDCDEATRWAVQQAARWGVDPERVAVAGDSAGGGLAAVVCLLARDRGPTITAQVLVYPGLDGTLSSPSLDTFAHAPILTKRKVLDYVARYNPAGDRRDPRFSPLHAAALDGLPAALIQTADHDPLVDDGRRYAHTLREAGVAVRYTEYHDVPHGFLSFPGAAASGDAPIAEIAQFLRKML
ncbi:alpha/beta hydrolase [Angustibacter sp. McL0619]|uniref:alpha/beta hydrolase n=1 Tax=Angustibacter sp. McL0619 TaxID=3415676 RepID=UPI003CF5F2A7